jgi:bifunctional non-homologous end joining protein LigD
VAARSSSRVAFIEPQLATLVSDPPDGTGWLHEVKFDGYRMECLLADGQARLLTRKGLDWTKRFPKVAELAATLPAHRALLDGEIVALLPDGRSSFQALQQALMSAQAEQVVYYAFDLLRLEQEDLRRLPLEERKQRLAKLLRGRRRNRRSTLRYSEHVEAAGAKVLAKACKLGLEGIVSKRRDAPYQSGRSRLWLKTKCTNRQELIVIGFTEPRGGRKGIGALVLGVHGPKGELQYAGKVGTGMGEQMLRSLRALLEPLRRTGAPVHGKLERGTGAVHWVDPKIVVEVEFTEWTEDGRLRHPSFVGVREDKPAREVRREMPAR